MGFKKGISFGVKVKLSAAVEMDRDGELDLEVALGRAPSRPRVSDGFDGVVIHRRHKFHCLGPEPRWDILESDFLGVLPLSARVSILAWCGLRRDRHVLRRIWQ